MKVYGDYGHYQAIQKRIFQNYQLYFNIRIQIENNSIKKVFNLSINLFNQVFSHKKIKCKQLKLVDVDGSVKRLRFNSKEILNFKDLSKDFKHKHFVEVIIENQDIESIQDNHFSKISFDYVCIKKYQKLRMQKS